MNIMDIVGCDQNEDVMWGAWGDCQNKITEYIQNFCHATTEEQYYIETDPNTCEIKGFFESLISLDIFRGWDLFKYDNSRGWCEEDYVNHPYIAEFWNTYSNIVLLFLALYGIFWHYKLHRKIHKQYVVCILIAMGSAWYHATLSRIGQLADELPMLALTTMLCYEFIKVKKLIIMSVVVSMVYIFIDSYTIFFLYFSLITGIVLLIPLTFKQRKLQKILYKKSMITFSFGFIVWIIDVNYCSYNTQYYHSMWHVFSGFALYWYIQFMMAKNGKLYNDFPLEVVRISIRDE